MVELDVFKLHSEDDKGKGKIKAVMTCELRKEITKLITDIRSSGIKPTEIARLAGVSYISLWDCVFRRSAISLSLIEKIIEVWSTVTSSSSKENKMEMQKHIEKLCYGTGSQKRYANAIIAVSDALAKLIGAIIADGHLKERDTQWDGVKVKHYEIVLREGPKEHVQLCCNWFNQLFGTDLKPQDGGNHWFIYVSNKIILRYFTKLIGIPTGNKSGIVKIPEIIKNSNIEIKKSFLEGLFIFDGSVERATAYIELYMRSPYIIKDVENIMIEIGVKPDYVKIDPDKFSRLIIRKKDKLRIYAYLFKDSTEKLSRLNGKLSL
ncbi:MAG: hypothetical protein HYS53_00200 [Candidatus Aenigmarchaeota archaeon]|nr:hypothetical protein [Candidatus Aenigmarchaeota archaeon]